MGKVELILSVIMIMLAAFSLGYYALTAKGQATHPMIRSPMVLAGTAALFASAIAFLRAVRPDADTSAVLALLFRIGVVLFWVGILWAAYAEKRRRASDTVSG